MPGRCAQRKGGRTRVALDQLFDVEGGSPLMTHLANGEKAIAGLRQDTTAIEERLRTFFGNLPEPASHRHQRRRPRRQF
jgi:hypothetical protein